MKKLALLFSGILLSVSVFSAEVLKVDLVSLTKQAESGNAEAQNVLGIIYYTKSDYATALKWYQQSANKNYAFAQYNLALLYDKGQGVLQDFHKAAYWYEKSAKNGNMFAQYNFGHMFYIGQAVTQDYSKAA